MLLLKFLIVLSLFAIGFISFHLYLIRATKRNMFSHLDHMRASKASQDTKRYPLCDRHDIDNMIAEKNNQGDQAAETNRRGLVDNFSSQRHFERQSAV
ncbi:MAG: hypothetical protein AAF621_06305 [Pseudomonadota bacterium]